MIRDAKDLLSGEIIETDVCIVGAGPTGLTLAMELAKANKRVCLLESGGTNVEPDAQKLSRAESVGEPYLPLGEIGTRVRAFGGTSRHWASNGPFRGRTLDPIDFEARAEIPHSGWPISFDDVGPYYRDAATYCDLVNDDFEPKTWHTQAELGDTFPDKTLRLAPFQLADSDWSRHLDTVRKHPNIDLIMHATATAFDSGQDLDRIDSITVQADTDHHFLIRPGLVVLATHALENARLLLLGSRNHPNGFGNEHDLVGRYFQDHTAVQAAVFRPTQEMMRSPKLNVFGTHPVPGHNMRICSMLGLSPEVVRDEGLLNPAFFVFPTTEAMSSNVFQSIRTLGRTRRFSPRPPSMAAHVANLVGHPGTVMRSALEMSGRAHHPDRFLLMAMNEQAPNPMSRVTLSNRLDRFGRRELKLDWRLTELDHWSMRRSVELIDESFHRLGWGRLEDLYGDTKPARQMWGQFHQLGTTRMSHDPRNGVVDTNSAVHGMANLYCAGGSVFTGGGYANPTLTMVALAARLADHLADRLDTTIRMNGFTSVNGFGPADTEVIDLTTPEHQPNQTTRAS